MEKEKVLVVEGINTGKEHDAIKGNKNKQRKIMLCLVLLALKYEFGVCLRNENGEIEEDKVTEAFECHAVVLSLIQAVGID